MIREIVFKGKTFDGKWVYGNLSIIATRDYYIKSRNQNQRFGCGIGVIPESVGQFTGYKDMVGIDVFEGDIIHSDNHNPSKYVIEFIDGGFMCTNKNISPIDLNHFYPSIGCQFKVIGDKTNKEIIV